MEFADVLTSPFMVRSLIAAVLVGLAAPVVGTYLVHRRLAMLGDGIGHVSLTGVALGWLIGSTLGLVPNDQLAIPGAIVAAIVGSVAIELVRRSGSASADVALAILFYGGIAGGVLIMGLAGGTSAQLNSYLFGSIATVSWLDIVLIGALGIVILATGIGLLPALFSVCNDEGFAASTGLPVPKLSMLLAVLSALTVAISMRVVGALLVSALMVVPVAIAQLFSRSFRQTMLVAMGTGTILCVAGLLITAAVDLSPGAMIVVLAILLYGITFAFHHYRRRLQRNPHRQETIEAGRRP